MAPGTKSGPRWKRAFGWLIKGYAAVCTLLVSALLASVVVVSIFSPEKSQNQHGFDYAYDQYMAHEFPKRKDYFCGMADALARLAQDDSVTDADVRQYLGRPDYVSTNSGGSVLVYRCGYTGITNENLMYVFLPDGMLKQIGYNPWNSNAVSDLQPYRE